MILSISEHCIVYSFLQVNLFSMLRCLYRICMRTVWMFLAFHRSLWCSYVFFAGWSMRVWDFCMNGFVFFRDKFFRQSDSFWWTDWMFWRGIFSILEKVIRVWLYVLFYPDYHIGFLFICRFISSSLCLLKFSRLSFFFQVFLKLWPIISLQLDQFLP